MKIYRRTKIVQEEEIRISLKAENVQFRFRCSECGSENEDGQVLGIVRSSDPSVLSDPKRPDDVVMDQN